MVSKPKWILVVFLLSMQNLTNCVKIQNPLVLHAGDAITGTLYFTLFGGSADAAVMNAGNFHYFTLGNHEFDAGNEGLLKLLEPLKIPVLSANVIPDKSSILYNKWKPYDIFTVDGEKLLLSV